LTKKIGNFQLALRNFKSGKHLNFDIDQDEIKMRNLVNLRLGRKYSQVAPATDRHGNSHRVSFYGESSEFVRSRRIIKSLEKRYETENLTEPKINNIHLSQLRMDSHRNLKFKQFRDSKFQ
jgi:hypothetical protein